MLGFPIKFFLKKKSFPIKFKKRHYCILLLLIKHMFVLTNKVQPILYFSRIIKINTKIYLNLIKKPNVLDLKECTQLWPYVILF